MYIILEMQTANGATVVVPPVVKDSTNKAWQQFYTQCAAASVSSVETHTVMLIHASGSVLESRTFRHGGEDE